MSSLARVAIAQRGERSRLILSVLLAAGASGAAIALLATSGYLISRAAQRPQMIALALAIVAVRAFGIARATLRYAERLASHDLALRQLARLRVHFYRSLAPLVPAQLDGRNRGELLARFVGDVDALQDVNLRVVIPSVVAVLVILGASGAGALMLGATGLVMLAALLTIAAVSSLTAGATAAVSGRRQSATRAALSAELIEGIDGADELAVLGQSARWLERIRATDRRLMLLSRRDGFASAAASGLHHALTGLGLLLVLAVSIAGVRSGSLSGLLLAAIAFLFLGACDSVMPLPEAARRLRSCRTAGTRLQDVTDQRPYVSDPDDPLTVPGGGALALEGVSMRYGPEEMMVLDGADLHIAAGERVALIGSSGVGKTTIAELLVRFWDPLHGRVALDGIDVRRLRLTDLRHEVLLGDQDAHLFNTTIRENLLIADRSAGDERLRSALATVELEHWVDELPRGMDTIVGQHGQLVSGGQRRRLALARALLSPARFLILDEPTAHLDGELAERVMANVLAAAPERAMLVITHDPRYLGGFDRVVKLEAGRLA